MKQLIFLLVLLLTQYSYAEITRKQAEILLIKSGDLGRYQDLLKELPNLVIQDLEKKGETFSEKNQKKFQTLAQRKIKSFNLVDKLIDSCAKSISKQDYQVLMSWYNLPESKVFVKKYRILINKETSFHFKDTDHISVSEAQIEQAKSLIKAMQIEESYKLIINNGLDLLTDEKIKQAPKLLDFYRKQNEEDKKAVNQSIHKRIQTYYPKYVAYVYADLSKKQKSDYIQLLKQEAFKQFFLNRGSYNEFNSTMAVASLFKIARPYQD